MPSRAAGLLEAGEHRQHDDRSEPVSSHAANNNRTPPDEQLSITRVFDAPPNEVFDAWTARERAMR
jgi:hypothetical protein